MRGPVERLAPGETRIAAAPLPALAELGTVLFAGPKRQPDPAFKVGRRLRRGASKLSALANEIKLALEARVMERRADFDAEDVGQAG